MHRGMAAYKINTGKTHPLDKEEGSGFVKRLTGLDPLTDDGNGTLWQGAVSVGTPLSEFTGMPPYYYSVLGSH